MFNTPISNVINEEFPIVEKKNMIYYYEPGKGLQY